MVVAGGIFAYFALRQEGPIITIEGSVTHVNNLCRGADGGGYCSITVENKDIIIACIGPWGPPPEVCPEKTAKNIDNPNYYFYEGDEVRATIEKYENDEFYNLLCDTCIIKITGGPRL